MTTAEFIQRAKAKHGDRYDYSKVEYVNSKTKVCIICPIHGEFWQIPYHHLKGNNCRHCTIEKAKKDKSIWTKEKCLELAKKCHSRAEFSKLNKSAYGAAQKNGWIKEYTWFEVLWEPKWDKESCYTEAQKYTSRGEFKNANPNAYAKARIKKWLDDYTWFTPVPKKVPAGYWTYEKCYEEARKYNTLKDFTQYAYGAKQVATKKGWIKDYTWFVKPFRWTKELCEQEARKYTTKNEFLKGNQGAHLYATRTGLIKTFDWFEELKKPNNYWTKDRCAEESRKYSSKKEFVKGCPAAHSAAVKNGWLDDFTWLIDQRFDIIKGKVDCVYVYIFEKEKVAYVGRTLMRRHKKRDKEHIFNNRGDGVAKYAEKHSIPVPPMTILETHLTLKEGLEREDYWRRWYEQHGYTMLNKSATGVLRGSLGAISNGKWTKTKCHKEAHKYTSASEFGKSSPSAYEAARRNGWLKDYTWFVTLKTFWDEQTCYSEAMKYKTRGDFFKGCRSAYHKSLKEGWINNYTWLHSRQQKPAGYWDNYEHCYEEAKKYTTRRKFQRASQGAYYRAWQNGWLDDYTWFKEKKKPNGYWNRETCYEEAQKYKSRSEFGKKAVRAYGLALEKGWIDDYTWFEDQTFIWSYELCFQEAKKYSKRGQFKAGCPGAYQKARKQGWLDEFFPKTK